MNESDIFAALETKVDADITGSFSQSSDNQMSNNYNKHKSWDKKDNPWNKSEFPPVNIDVNKFKKKGRSFAVAFSKTASDIPEEAASIMLNASRALVRKGFIFRHNGDADDAIQNLILDTEGIYVESYLPWSNYNRNIVKPVLKYPKENAYCVASAYHSAFSKIPAAIRAKLASEVHTLLGAECDNPIDLLIAYSPDGDEAMKPGIDFARVGNLSFYLRVCEAANIPIFNVSSSKRPFDVQRIVDYIKSLEG